MKKLGLAVLALVTLGFAGCSSNGLRPSQELKNFTDLSHRSLLDRIVPIPALLLDDLRREDKRPDYQAYTPTGSELALIAESVARLPESLKAALASEVVGISFLERFAGGGMTWDLHDGSTEKDWLIFNPRILKVSISEWLTFRDNTAIEAAPGFKLTESASKETPAFLATLIHEAAHVFDFAHLITPMESGWNLPQPNFEHQGDLHFYGFSDKPKLAAASLPAVVDGLARSGFASLYSAQNNLDDWAELITYGVLSELDIEVTLALTTPEGTKTYVPTMASLTSTRMAKALQTLEK